jgi:hypothetical protein
MSKSLLITRPSYEITTRYLYVWNKKIIREAFDRGINVLDLKKEKAVKNEFMGRMKKINPALVLLNGHGDSDCVTGHNGEVIVRVGDNEEILKGKIIYALACKSASCLGPKSVQAGAVAFVGYLKDFVFFNDDSKIAHPENDRVAGLFLDPSNRLSISLVKGNNVSDASKKSRKAFAENIKKLLNSDNNSPNYSSSFIPYLVWNMKHQACYGNQHACF